MRTKMILTSLTIGLMSLASIGTAHAVPSVGNVSVWNSSVPFAPPILPIGGSGQINGEFQIDTVTSGQFAFEIGLRAQERFVGPTLPRSGSTYFADPGIAGSTPGALWNYDFHLDFGTSFLANKLGGGPLIPLNMRDFGVFFALDTDPGVGTSFVITDLNAAIPASIDLIHLVQTSQNILFGVFGGPLDPTIPGLYDFGLLVTFEGTEIASTSMQVNVGNFGVEEVPEPASIALFGLGLAGLGIARRKRRN